MLRSLVRFGLVLVCALCPLNPSGSGCRLPCVNSLKVPMLRVPLLGPRPKRWLVAWPRAHPGLGLGPIHQREGGLLSFDVERGACPFAFAIKRHAAGARRLYIYVHLQKVSMRKNWYARKGTYRAPSGYGARGVASAETAKCPVAKKSEEARAAPPFQNLAQSWYGCRMYSPLPSSAYTGQRDAGS